MCFGEADKLILQGKTNAIELLVFWDNRQDPAKLRL
jgi:hypothetical protein